MYYDELAYKIVVFIIEKEKLIAKNYMYEMGF